MLLILMNVSVFEWLQGKRWSTCMENTCYHSRTVLSSFIVLEKSGEILPLPRCTKITYG
jgi:hypothetical protein